MTAAHIIYIPVALLLGLVGGYIMGARAARREIEERRKQAQR